TRRGGGSAFFGRHARALLAPVRARESYLAEALDRKKRKELRRQRKRLADGGSVTAIDAATPSEGACALEAQGWKGRAGTAARCDGGIAAFMERAVTALAGEGKARVARLCVDAQPIAAIVTVRSGASA